MAFFLIFSQKRSSWAKTTPLTGTTHTCVWVCDLFAGMLRIQGRREKLKRGVGEFDENDENEVFVKSLTKFHKKGGAKYRRPPPSVRLCPALSH